MSALLDRVLKARDAYYSEGDSGLTDDEYDALVSELKASGEGVDELAAEVKGPWPKLLHVRPMGSIGEQLRTEAQCSSWAKDCYVSLKYDGLALELVYVDGKLDRAVLRGDGSQGEDIIENVRYLLPKEVPIEVAVGVKLFAVYGELVISWNNLDVLNELRSIDGLEPYKTPRNAVSGMRKRNNKQLAQLCAFRAYGVHPMPGTPLDVVSIVTKYGFNVASQLQIPCYELWATLLRAAERVKLGEIAYQIDGLVAVDVDSERVAKVKFEPDAAVTTVRQVIDSLGRTGIISPVIELDPVKLGGVTVSRATGHNHELIARQLTGIGPGAKVMVSRRGDVIPHVEFVLEPSPIPWVPPAECPSCGAETVEDGSVVRCSADPMLCPGTTLGLLVKFCRSVGIDGIGPSIALHLVNSTLAMEPAHLYGMTPPILAELNIGSDVEPRVLGERVAERIVNSVWEKGSTMTWGQLLGAVGIRGCATSVMESIATAFPNDVLLGCASEEEIASVPGVGPVRARSVRAFIETRWHVVTELLEFVSLLEVKGPLTGETVCITLGLSVPRTDMEARIRLAGGAIKSSVSKAVTLVVCNEPDGATSKLVAARRLGIRIVNEAELVRMMGGQLEQAVPSPEPDEEF